MLELLLLIPLFMIGLLNMTFQVSVDEITDVRHESYINLRKYDVDHRMSVEDQVHHFYSRMLDESENEIGIDLPSKKKSTPKDKKLRNPLFKEGQCDMKQIQMMHIRCFCRKPKERCVKIEVPQGNVVVVLPECAPVRRCEGACLPGKVCRPTQTRMSKIPVLYWNLLLTHSNSDVPECSVVEIEEHEKCSCSCLVQEKDCSDEQIFNPGTCRCECREKQLAEMCAQKNKVWDTSTCQCICPPDQPQMCSSGAFFHTGICRCVPKSESYPQGRTRRRPPV